MDLNALRYAASHEWAKLDADLVTVGITKFAVELLKPKPMSASLLVSTPLTTTGVAVLLWVRFCTCEVKAAPKSSLKPSNFTPSSFVVSN